MVKKMLKQPGEYTDTSPDWRVRLPMLLLPLLILALLASLTKLHQLNQQTERQLDVMQFDWQALQKGRISGSRDTAAALPQTEIGQAHTDPGIQGLRDLAITLQRWLEQDRTTRAQARFAKELSDRVQAMQDGSIDDARQEFWQPFAASLLKLEHAVETRLIKSPEAGALIVELRGEYNRLSAAAATSDGSLVIRRVDSRPPAPLATAGASVASAQQLAASVAAARDLQASSRRLALLSLGLAAAALALLALLAYGLLRSHANLRLSNAGRNRHEQAATLRLLDDMAPLANGDLRVRADVSEASTGALADAFNHAVTELRWLVRAVKDSSDQVKAAVSDAREATGKLAQDGSVQAREVHRSSNYLSVMSDTMAQLSAHATESSHIADTSVTEAEAGAEAVEASMKGLLRVRDQAEMTTRLMQRLVESSEAINGRAEEIREVARRTDLLALNTTIRAAAVTGEDATDDLSRLADDVAQLADVLNVATRNIVSLTDVIRQDAAQTMQSMAQTVAELGAGHEQAKQASISLDSIRLVSGELQTLIGEIATKTLRQAGVVRQLSGNMGVINDITRDSAGGLRASVSTLEQLDEMASELRQSVAYFRLPLTSAGTAGEPGAANKQLASARAGDVTSTGSTVAHG